MGVIFGSGVTGLVNCYAQIRSLMDGKIGNGTAMEVYSQAHWDDYVISTPENAGAGEYALTIPGYLPAGRYKASFFVPEGSSPTSGDSKFATEIFDWDGTDIINVGSSLDVGAINGSAAAAVSLALVAANSVSGAAASGTLTTSQMTTNLTDAIANVYAGRVIYFTSGANYRRAALITAYAVTGGKLTFIAYNNQPITAAPTAGDTFVII